MLLTKSVGGKHDVLGMLLGLLFFAENPLPSAASTATGTVILRNIAQALEDAPDGVIGTATTDASVV